MSKSWIIILGAVCFVAMTASLPAQTAIIRSSSGAVRVVPSLPPDLESLKAMTGITTSVPATPNAPPPAGANANGSTPPPAPDENQLRLQKFTKLTFDRRGSTILKELASSNQVNKKTEESKSATKENDDTPSPEETDAQKTARLTAEINQRLDQELKSFQKDVTLGHWEAIRGFFTSIPTNHVDQTWRHLTQSLSRPAGMPPNQPIPPNQQRRESHVMSPTDLFGLADAFPGKLAASHVGMLSGFLSKILAEGYDLNSILETLRQGTRSLGGQEKDRRILAARLLGGAGKRAESLEFLITPEEAVEAKDAESLNLIAVGYLDHHAKKPDDDWLVKAWEVTQMALALDDIETSEKEQALNRALQLTSQIDKELAETWLEQVFGENPAAGLEIVTTTGASSAQQRANRSASARLKQLEIQHRAVESLLEHNQDQTMPWAETLNLMALNWLTEAEYTYQNDQTQSRFPSMQWDMYGNMFYSNSFNNRPRNPNQPEPISTGDILKFQPKESWLSSVKTNLQPKFMELLAKLHLKVKEEEQAFPYIEKLAGSHPDEAHELANEFVRIWTENHDPNTERNRRSTYMYIYGYNRTAEGIPLTRSKQVRNLAELTTWIDRLRELDIEPVDESLLAKAFTTCHSVAEVYKLEDIEQVFGNSDTLKPETLAGMIQTMRSNLATIWRQPDVQKSNQTQRKDKEIQAEVFRGYDVANAVLEKGLVKYPESWALHLAQACILFDENTYRYELTKDSQFSSRRAAAFEAFAKAASLYKSQVEELPQDKESSEIYEFWFYASLGATDLGGLRDFHQPDLKQAPLIKEALLGLPGPTAERHLARFANSLSTRITALKAELKHRYLKAGLSIVGEHEKAREAKKLYDYYNDLVTEIQLAARIDGSANVGHEEPFGLFVDIRHTKEVERESGGFAKYLQNQNNVGYYYNYGRPTVNYRDDFEEAAREALKEQFEVLSVTFHSDKTQSIGDMEPGWRRTPYAYLLLKPLGPEVDMIPSLQMDFDFMDTSGYVVLPVESPKLAIDASKTKAEERPYRDLTLTQMLDERRADEGVLVLEIKAVAHGLIPDLSTLVSFKQGGFEIESTDDQGVAVSTIDQESEDLSPIAERQWMIRMKARPELTERPKTFAFPTPKTETKKVIYQRYQDADLASVGPEIILMASYGKASSGWQWMVLILLVVGAAGYALYRTGNATQPETMSSELAMPDPLTPFTAIGLLKKIKKESALSEEDSEQLAATLRSLETDFFSPESRDLPDLKKTLRPWLEKAG